MVLVPQRVSDRQLWINPGCGLKTRKWEEVRPALVCRSKSLTLDANHSSTIHYPARGCVPSQQSILPPLRNVIGDWRLGAIFGKIIERFWCFGEAKCCCATASGSRFARRRYPLLVV
ncbi:MULTISPECIES: hypothetical protein [unclassified Bradyrhizobium]|uniref:hypothetical protein n=1 Tax=unclassified Bradyrhizobium TaxID=2631580 RepID=UPI00339700DB